VLVAEAVLGRAGKKLVLVLNKVMFHSSHVVTTWLKNAPHLPCSLFSMPSQINVRGSTYYFIASTTGGPGVPKEVVAAWPKMPSTSLCLCSHACLIQTFTLLLQPSTTLQ
jgi:hypothetical protein